MTAVIPEGTPTLGNTKIKFALAVADLAVPSLGTEVNAASSVEASCHIYPAGWTPTGSTSKGTKPLRLCSKKAQEKLNRTMFSIGDLQYVYDPQAADSAAGNEVKEIAVEGAEIYVIERLGLDAETVDWAVGQRVRTHHLVFGPQIPSGDRTDENGEFYITQSVAYVNDGPVDGVLAA